MLRNMITITTLFFISTLAIASPKYIVIIDAGSSGSRLNIYQVDDTQANLPIIEPAPYPLVEGQMVWSKKITPGLNSFASHSDDIEAYIKPLLDFASDKLRNVQANPNEVTFHLYGTAGMRLLPEAQQALIYNKLINIVNSHFSYPILPVDTNHVKTISGQEEAVYDWLAVNYLDNQLSSSHTVGVMDMGGASTQIAFAASQAPNPKDIVEVHFRNQTFHIYAKSYLGLGQDQARLNFSTSDCYPINYIFKEKQQGSGNYAACANVVSQKLNEGVYSVKRDTPSLPSDETFYAISGYYYTHSFFEQADPLWKSNDMENLGSSYCQATWSSLHNQYPDDAYLGIYCFNLAYFNTLVTQGFGFAKTASNIKTANMIHGKEISWALGAAIKVYDEYHANHSL